MPRDWSGAGVVHVVSAPRNGPCKLPRTGRRANAFPTPVVQTGGDAQLARPPAPSTPRAHPRFRAPHPLSLLPSDAPPARPASSPPPHPARAASSGCPRPVGGLDPAGAGTAARHRRHPRLSPLRRVERTAGAVPPGRQHLLRGDPRAGRTPGHHRARARAVELCRRARCPRADAVRRARHAALRHRGRLRHLALVIAPAIELAAQRARQRVAREGLGHEGT